jgi:hypothetical protein
MVLPRTPEGDDAQGAAHPGTHLRRRGEQVTGAGDPGIGARQPGQHRTPGRAVPAGSDGDRHGGGMQERAGRGSDNDLSEPAVGRRSEDEQIAGVVVTRLGQGGGNGPALRSMERGVDVRPLVGQVATRLVQCLFAGLVRPLRELGVHLGHGQRRPVLRDDGDDGDVFLLPRAGRLRGQIETGPAALRGKVPDDDRRGRPPRPRWLR